MMVQRSIMVYVIALPWWRDVENVALNGVNTQVITHDLGQFDFSYFSQLSCKIYRIEYKYQTH